MTYAVRHVYVGTWGEYEIPPDLRDVKIRKDGWPDLRYKRAMDLLAWANLMEESAKVPKP